MLGPTETDRFVLTVGVNPGYNHDNEFEGSTHDVARIWQKIAAGIEDRVGFRLTACIVPSLALYHEGRGCPAGGEEIVIFVGTRNPQHSPYRGEWVAAVVEAASAIKAALGQSTASLEFSKVVLHYMT